MIYSIIEFYINNELKHYINETSKKKNENLIVEYTCCFVLLLLYNYELTKIINNYQKKEEVNENGVWALSKRKQKVIKRR